MRFIFIVALLMLTGSPDGFGKSVRKTNPKVASKKGATSTKSTVATDTVKSKLIRKELKKELPKFICSEDSKTLKCHRISRKKCYKLIKKQLRSCLKKNKTKRLISSVESMRYSQAIGLCLKDGVEPVLKKYKKECSESPSGK